MKKEPVAWIDEETGCFVYSQYDYEDLDEHGKDGLIPLYTNPVNTCKHGVDDGACKECYIEVTHPVKDINEAIEIIKDFQNSDVPPCKDYENTYADGWMDACNEILWAIEEKAQEK